MDKNGPARFEKVSKLCDRFMALETMSTIKGWSYTLLGTSLDAKFEKDKLGHR